MRLTANSGVYRIRSDKNEHIASLEYLHHAGFAGMDINLHGAIIPGSYLAGDGWKGETEAVAEAARRLEMRLDQSHLPFYNFADPGCPDLEEKNRMFARAIEASGILGIKWAVFHPGNAVNTALGAKESKHRTMEFLKPYLELAEKHQVGIAIENLFVPRKQKKAYRYCSWAEEVCDLVDSIPGNVGVCWDFGHANLLGDDQTESLKLVGNRLKVIHVHDNDGKKDDHQVPFTYCCNVDWGRILPVLKEIGYEGNFNFEIINPKMPAGAAEGFGIYLRQLGTEMIRMMEERPPADR